MSIQKISSTIVYDDNFALKTIKKVENYEIFRKLAWLTAYVALASFVMLNLIAVGTNTCSTMTNTLTQKIYVYGSGGLGIVSLLAGIFFNHKHASAVKELKV